MGQLLLILISALVVGAVVFGVSVLITGGDPGLEPAEPDGRAVPMPTSRPLVEEDVARARFDVALRGYRMAQVDQALSRMAYDIGYKDELIDVLQAEVAALRSGRFSDAEVLRRAREAALSGAAVPQVGLDLLAERETVDGEAREPEADTKPEDAEPEDADAEPEARTEPEVAQETAAPSEPEPEPAAGAEAAAETSDEPDDPSADAVTEPAATDEPRDEPPDEPKGEATEETADDDAFSGRR